MVKLVLCVILNILWTFRSGTCSIAELNDTTLASLPPLYGLDDWTQCQNPGDVYCIVDAGLLADGPSTTLALLEVYSSETLKHYNRTLLHRGICVSRCANNTSLEVNGSETNDGSNAADSSQWYEAAQMCVQDSMDKYDLKWFNVLFHSSLFIGGAVVLSGTVFLQDSPPPHWAAPVYAALDRTIVAVCFGVFMLGCVSKCHSALRSALSWRGFHPLGRLSYCAFLFHFIVLRLTLASNTQLGHATLFSLIALLVTASTLTYAVSVPLCLLIELPAMQLFKAVMSQGPAHDEERPQPAAKSLDLVPHVGRQPSSS